MSDCRIIDCAKLSDLSILEIALLPNLRRLYMSGLSGIFVILMIVGFLGIASDSNKAASWAVGVLIVIMLLVFQVRTYPFHF